MSVSLATTVASQIPWMEFASNLPALWRTATGFFDKSSSKAGSPPVDPTADVRVQLNHLATRVHDGAQAQADQAKIVALLADQMQAMASQVQLTSSRARQALWFGVAGCVISAVSVLIVLLKS